MALTASGIQMTASATVNYGLGGVADKDDAKNGHLGFVHKVLLGTVTVPVGAGTVTVQVFKYDASASAAVALSAAFDAEALVAGKVEEIPLTGTDVQRTLDVGDFLYVAIVCSSTVTTNFEGAAVTALVKLLR